MNETYKRVTKKHEKAISHIPLWLEDLAKHTNYKDKDDGLYTIIDADRRTPAVNKLINKAEEEYMKSVINKVIKSLKKEGYEVQHLDYNKYFIKNFNYKIDFEELFNNNRTTEKSILFKIKSDIDKVSEEEIKEKYDKTNNQETPKEEQSKNNQPNFIKQPGNKNKENLHNQQPKQQKEKQRKYQDQSGIPTL